MPSLDLRQPRQLLFCKVEFYLQRHYTHATSRAHPLRLAKLYHAKPLDNILRMEYISVKNQKLFTNKIIKDNIKNFNDKRFMIDKFTSIPFELNV